jgi:membrane protein YqaA with SNARE-associated domain
VISATLAAAGVGFVSALLPVVNAEAYLAGSSFLQPTAVIVACTVALAVGQTGGKLVIFSASRRGATRWRSGHAGRRSWAPAWVGRVNACLLHRLSHPVGGPAAVAVSATVGLPPLALVSATAGASTLRCRAFVLACLAGRLVRFAGLAGAVAAVTGASGS